MEYRFENGKLIIEDEFMQNVFEFSEGDYVKFHTEELFKVVKWTPSKGKMTYNHPYGTYEYFNEKGELATVGNENVIIEKIEEKTVSFLNTNSFSEIRFTLSLVEAAYALFPVPDKEEVVDPSTIPCHMCLDAQSDPLGELTPQNDASFISLGKSDKGFRMMYQSGMGKPNRILSERWNEKRNEWETIGFFEPTFCPNCGRKLKEIGGK